MNGQELKPKDDKSYWNNELYTKEQIIKAMIWAEDNGRDFIGTDIKGQLKQFEKYLTTITN